MTLDDGLKTFEDITCRLKRLSKHIAAQEFYAAGFELGALSHIITNMQQSIREAIEQEKNEGQKYESR